MTAVIITSMSKKAYDEYGQYMIKSFLKYVKGDFRMLVFTEDNIKESGFTTVNIYEENKDYADFIKANSSNPKITGYLKKQKYNFMFDAIRFSKKVFAITHTIKNCLEEFEKLFWFDSDTLVLENINLNTIAEKLPDGCFSSYLGRKRIKIYPETGFLGFANFGELSTRFAEEWENIYYNLDFIKRPQDYIAEGTNEFGFTDCHTYDYMRRRYEAEHGVKFFDITSNLATSSPFDTAFSNKIKHYKGDRKAKIASTFNNKELITSYVRNQSSPQLTTWKRMNGKGMKSSTIMTKATVKGKSNG